MARRQLSIRARLTLFFVASAAAVIAFTSLALVSLVHSSLVRSANDQVDAAIVSTQNFLTNTKLPERRVSLPMHGDVVIQVTNAASSQVWAASAPIIDAPVLAEAYGVNSAISDYQARIIATSSKALDVSQLSQGMVQTVQTSRGPGLVFGFVYGTSITHSFGVILASVAVSFPLLLLLAGVLVWYGLGLALAPVERIRRRVERIAARDLAERVPVPGGDDEIARLARTLNAMLDRLESSSTFQQEFVSNASHELRSPLTTLLATVERAAQNPDDANWPSAAETIRREGRRLDAIIDDLFWLARHDESRLEVVSRDVDLDDVLYEEAQRVRAISDLAVDTSQVGPTRVTGDPRLFKRMISNVVDNAVRHARSKITLGSRYEGDVVVLSVADDGEGVDVQSASRFFERFVRADPARDRQTGGTGLGLAIVTDIVTRYGGSARFVPSEVGACVELRVRIDGAGA